MRNITEHNITEAVIGQLAQCANPRLKEIMTLLVKHVHGFVREARLTEAEWMQGIEFLTATGQKCDDKRQEFILLSDTLGVSMLTVALNNAKPPGATESTVFGPFHVQGAPELALGDDISAGAAGEPLFVQATVKGLNDELVANAQVDVWQADEDGFYDVQYEGSDQLRARAVLRTNDQGRLWFRSMLPVAYPVPTDGPVGQMLQASGRQPWRPAHVHFMVQAEGYETLITHVFRDDDQYLDSDVVFGVRSSLVARFVHHAAGAPPFGPATGGGFYTLDFDLVLNPTAPAARELP